MATVERPIEVLERSITPRQRLHELSQDEFELELSHDELNNPIQEIIATHYLYAARRSGIWNEKGRVYFDMMYPRDREVLDGDKKIREGSGKLFYQTQANIWAELAHYGLVNPRAADFVVNVFIELQQDNRNNMKYLMDEWIYTQKLTEDEKESIKFNIYNDTQTIQEASLVVKKFFRDEFEPFTANSVDPIAIKLGKITDARADFINGTGTSMISLMYILLKNIPEPSTTA